MRYVTRPPAQILASTAPADFSASGAPGRWLDAATAFRQYKPIFRRYRLVGDNPLIKIRRLRRVLRRLGIEAGWYDTHARL